MIMPQDLIKYGITDTMEIVYNPSYNLLFAEETKPVLSKYEKGIITKTGANENTRLSVRFILEVAWQAHFVKNVFIRPEPEDLNDFKPDFIVLNASKATNPDWEKQGLNSENFVFFNITEGMAVVGGTWYGGEMKKGIFNFEGGCYAKCIKLSKKNEPDIYNAIRRDALLENLVVLSDGTIDFDDESKTENTRVSYPIYHINNIVKPVSKAGHAKKVIFLSADTFGVLPPVSRLTEEQTRYYFLSGCTAKVAGTERGIVEPVPSFSACFSAAFLMLDPIIYANELTRKMKMHNAEAWLVNTGWMGGPYGTGNRIDLPSTRRIINAILDDSIKNCEFVTLPVFNLSIPTKIKGVDDNIFDPGKAWNSPAKWHTVATDLALKFINNFSKFTGNNKTARLAEHSPRI